MQSDWTVLKKPPVIIAIFQLKFSHNENVDLKKMIENDANIRKIFTRRNDNYHSNIGVQGTPVPGISLVKAKADTKINSYTYFNYDQKKKFIIENDNISFLNEEPYNGWQIFKLDVLSCLELLSKQLLDCCVTRTSIRFINKVSLPSFDNPMDYFSKTISTDTSSKYPFSKYAFRLNLQVPDSEIFAIINHALEPTNMNNYDYYLDIDVLDHKQLNFDLNLISDQLEKIRIVKNEIFFDTVKQKTIDLCS